MIEGSPIKENPSPRRNVRNIPNVCNVYNIRHARHHGILQQSSHRQSQSEFESRLSHLQVRQSFPPIIPREMKLTCDRQDPKGQM
jgi:hypothetical protein